MLIWITLNNMSLEQWQTGPVPNIYNENLYICVQNQDNAQYGT